MSAGARRRPVAVIGAGRLGAACIEAIRASEDLRLAGVVLRSTSVPPAVATGAGAPVATHVRELGAVAVALVCVPPAACADVARGLLERGVAVVECAQLAEHERPAHAAALEHAAHHGRAVAIVGAGWDPGALALLSGLAQLLAPHGHTELRHHATPSLHHTLAVRNVPGVRDAVCTELPAEGGRRQRYVYVELEPGAELAKVDSALRADPLFFDEETLVLPVASAAAVEAEGEGLTLERRGAAGGLAHQRFLFEARFDLHAAAAQVMVAAARAVERAEPGVRTLLDLPFSALLGARAAQALLRAS